MIVQFIMASFAVYRLTGLLVNEDGPFDLIGRFRDTIGVRRDERGRCTGNVLARGFCCFRCISIWSALIAALIIASDPVEVIGWTLAISGGAVWLWEVR